MIRVIRYHGCDPSMGTAPKIKIKPPVFASATDAWNHFVRHPEEFMPVDEDEDLSSDSQMYQDEDIFDSIDRFMFSKGVPSGTPPSSEHEGNEGASEERADEEPAKKEDGDE